MRIYLSTVKCLVFAFNIICLILGIGAVSFSALGIQNAQVGSDEHAYFLVGIILGALISLTTFIGCYGVVCELLGVNIVYGFLLLILVVVQYLQMHNFQPHNFYRHELTQVEHAWQQIQTQPYLMAAIEQNFHCCARDNSSDYEYQHLATPSSCYHQHHSLEQPAILYNLGCRQAFEISYQFAIKREILYNWCMMIAECLALAYAFILVAMLYFQRRHLAGQPLRNFVDRYANHIGSRSLLIPEYT